MVTVRIVHSEGACQDLFIPLVGVPRANERIEYSAGSVYVSGEVDRVTWVAGGVVVWMKRGAVINAGKDDDS